MDVASAAESATSALDKWKPCAATVDTPSKSEETHHSAMAWRGMSERTRLAPLREVIMPVATWQPHPRSPRK